MSYILLPHSILFSKSFVLLLACVSLVLYKNIYLLFIIIYLKYIFISVLNRYNRDRMSTSLKAIKAVLIDLSGTLHRENEAITGAAEALKK